LKAFAWRAAGSSRSGARDHHQGRAEGKLRGDWTLPSRSCSSEDEALPGEGDLGEAIPR